MLFLVFWYLGSAWVFYLNFQSKLCDWWLEGFRFLVAHLLVILELKGLLLYKLMPLWTSIFRRFPCIIRTVGIDAYPKIKMFFSFSDGVSIGVVALEQCLSLMHTEGAINKTTNNLLQHWLCICFYDNAAMVFCVLWEIRQSRHAPLGHLNGTCNFILFAFVWVVSQIKLA